MNSMARKALAWALFIPLVAGCATTGSRDQTEATLNSTYRIVKKLDETLGPSVTKLNESAADLSARVDASDKEIAKLQSMSEENQKRLDRIQSKLDKLAKALYSERGISAPDSPALAPTATPPPSEEFKVDDTKVTPAPPAKVEPSEATPPPAPPKVESASNAKADFEAAKKTQEAGKFDEAIRQYQEFLQRYPDSENCESAQIRIAFCYAKVPDYEKAAAEYKKFRTNYPNSTNNIPVALYNEANAYKNLNQKARAIELFKELVENYPSSAAAERGRAALKVLQSGN
ncbi:MAG: tetratricopeptide repeat protein [Candidatus Hydrogenedentes bacterium]|nr:tetratricopeptide repeat protein [Candidatus Hydrogenedentota bacterium]